ncbi:MAG: carboxypeptidase regulatory-like domain-containing protein [Deltaproteobacteria bacterium]|nr:carboxypeptidase regulatory-like domain-containing protein [Deltaproteobacteria bacterium]
MGYRQPPLSITSQLVRYDPAGPNIVALNEGTIAPGSFHLKVWANRPVCEGWWSFVCFGIELPEDVPSAQIHFPSISVEPATHRGYVSGTVRDAVTNQPLLGAAVVIYGGSSVVASGSTDVLGSYSFAVPVGDGYRIEVSKTGYLKETYSGVAVTLEDVTYLETILQVDNSHSGAGSAQGRIVSALDGNGVSGVAIALRKGINVRSGSVVSSTSTASDGTYSFTGLAAGNYTGEVTHSGFSGTFFTVLIIGGQSTYGGDVAIRPILPTGATSIILSWGEYPYDLDEHLTGPLPDGARFHMYFPYKDDGGTGSPWPDYVHLAGC